MNVVLIGSGGRENAMAYKISQSKLLTKLFLVPGNPGTEAFGENVSLNINDDQAVVDFCISNAIELVVIGPEVPLVNGLADILRRHEINVFGPGKDAAMIEGDKAFAKKLMLKYNIPTAGFEIFTKSEYPKAVEHISFIKYPAVIKASGLAAGKGVLICQSFQEAKDALSECFEDALFGEAGETIVIEEFMTGQEASIFAVTDGKNFICLPSAQDHKRIGDNDTGKNTGGMGAYAPAPIVTHEILNEIEVNIIRPTLDALNGEGRKFNGCLYCGIMLTPNGPKVVEFNCRFGDPETQSVLPLLEGDFLQLLSSAAKGDVDKTSVSYNGGAAVCVVAASEGYPDKYEKGFEISGLDDVHDEAIVFHAGTKKIDGKIVTDGGRVLGVTAVTSENNLQLCKEKAYKALRKIYFDNIYYRTDIADKGFKKS
ncbi:MAG: phosphoribosylamine--glycine ligase [Ignavibacteria bacterium]